MQFTVTCDGVPIGRTDLPGLAGLRAGYLAPTTAYEALGVRAIARRVGVALLVRDWGRVGPAATARVLAGVAVTTDALAARLALVDAAGSTALVGRLYVVELPRRARPAGPFVVADLGEVGAGRAAPLPVPAGGAPAG